MITLPHDSPAHTPTLLLVILLLLVMLLLQISLKVLDLSHCFLTAPRCIPILQRLVNCVVPRLDVLLLAGNVLKTKEYEEITEFSVKAGVHTLFDTHRFDFGIHNKPVGEPNNPLKNNIIRDPLFLEKDMMIFI